MKFLAMLLCLMPTVAFAGNEGPGPGTLPADACGAPYKIDYIKFVAMAGIQGCGQFMKNFNTSAGHGIISSINGLRDPNLFYSVLVQDPATGKSLSAVVKCDTSSGEASLLTLDFAATTAYGGCSI